MTCTVCKRDTRPQRSAVDGRPRYAARGLCTGCWKTQKRLGTLDRYPRRHGHRSSDTLDDYLEVVQEIGTGRVTRVYVAARLHMTLPALEQALLRARRKGDPRAVVIPRSGSTYAWVCAQKMTSVLPQFCQATVGELAKPPATPASTRAAPNLDGSEALMSMPEPSDSFTRQVA